MKGRRRWGLGHKEKEMETLDPAEMARKRIAEMQQQFMNEKQVHCILVYQRGCVDCDLKLGVKRTFEYSFVCAIFILQYSEKNIRLVKKAGFT